MAALEKNLGFEHMPKGPSGNKNRKEQTRTASVTPLGIQQSVKEVETQAKVAEVKNMGTPTGIPS